MFFYWWWLNYISPFFEQIVDPSDKQFSLSHLHTNVYIHMYHHHGAVHPLDTHTHTYTHACTYKKLLRDKVYWLKHIMLPGKCQAIPSLDIRAVGGDQTSNTCIFPFQLPHSNTIYTQCVDDNGVRWVLGGWGWAHKIVFRLEALHCILSHSKQGK